MDNYGKLGECKKIDTGQNRANSIRPYGIRQLIHFHGDMLNFPICVKIAFALS